jgi:hypothetical protein
MQRIMVPERVKSFARDRFFAELDGRHLMVAGIDWSLEVYGILEQHGRRWVQLALTGEGEGCMVTLKLGPKAGTSEVLETLSTVLTDRSDAPPQILTIA